MKLLSFKIDGRTHVGISAAEGIVDLTRALAATHPDMHEAGSLLAIIEAGIDIDTVGEGLPGSVAQGRTLADYLVVNPHWLPPLPRPPKSWRWRSTIRPISTKRT